MLTERHTGAALRQLCRCWRNRDGNTAVEFALIMPALFSFLVGIMFVGLALWRQNALDYSVAEAARCASDASSTCGTSTQITAYAAGVSGGNFDSAVFTYTAPTAGSCGYLVTASYPMSVPYLNLSMTLTSRACWPK
jgi:Flp pilus assembly protein TadG